MIRIIASIRLYKDGRRTPFYSGYRPLFDFIEETKTSGQITLLLIRRALGDNFSEGTKFTFGEGRKHVGEGEVKEILELE